MGFELVIAARRDPVETAVALKARQPVRSTAALPIATLDVGGAFSHESANDLARHVLEILQSADSVIVRFETIRCDSPESFVGFASWVDRLRQGGHDIRVASGEPHVHALLAEAAISTDAVIDLGEANSLAGRRTIDADRR